MRRAVFRTDRFPCIFVVGANVEDGVLKQQSRRDGLDVLPIYFYGQKIAVESSVFSGCG